MTDIIAKLGFFVTNLTLLGHLGTPKNIFIKYRLYLQYNTPSMLLINGTTWIPVLIISAYFSPAAAGLYAIANRVVNIPVAALGNAISKTYMRKVAEDHADNHIEKIQIYTKQLINVLFPLLLIPFSLLSVVGEPLFSIVLGDKWNDAGILASALSYLAMTTLLTQTFGGLFDVMSRQKMRLYFHICNFIVRIGGLYICIQFEISLIETVILYSIFSTCMNLVALQLLFSFIDKKELLANVIAQNLIQVLLFFLSAWLFNELFESELTIFVALLFVSFIWLWNIVCSNNKLKIKISRILSEF